MTYQEILNRHREFFATGKTFDIEFRRQALARLKSEVKAHERHLLDALYADLRKPELEAYATEIGIVLNSIGFVMKHLKSWARVKRVHTPLVQFWSGSYIYPEPYGTVLIIGPFNYPFQLLIEPLIGAIAAGNCGVLKPSENAPRVSEVVREIITASFPESYVSMVEGDRDVISDLIHLPFDYIFFTGSMPVGKVIMQAAASHLTPITLELGGKSPCIVHHDCNLRVACERIAWGKFMNAGQTCVAPDYLLVHRSIREPFLKEMQETLYRFYGDDPRLSPDFGRIVNQKHTERLAGIIQKDHAKVIWGGEVRAQECYVAPTLIDDADYGDASMEDEIFGPVLPVLYYDDPEALIRQVNSHPKPLALYLFTADKRLRREILRRISFGGGCVNDTINHLATPYLPFGGVGASGMGAYHGRKSFETFSHPKSVMVKTTLFTAQPVFPPYQDRVKLLRMLLK